MRQAVAVTQITLEVSTTGVIAVTFRRAGDVQTGSFALDEPSERELARRKAMEAQEAGLTG
jgi:hypothetical protein